MTTSKRYSANDPAFDAVHGVLKNRLGLTDEQALQRAEKQALIIAYDRAAMSYSETHRFTADDVCRLHTLFLGEIYSWAGSYRSVDISSPGIRWCHAAFIEGEMVRLDGLFREATPLSPQLPREKIIARVAEIHGELIVIHPFRDGNGRTARLLCDLLLMQAGLLPISPDVYDDKETQALYFAAIRDVWARADYEKLTRLLAMLTDV